jgi:hypothetical protein
MAEENNPMINIRQLTTISLFVIVTACAGTTWRDNASIVAESSRIIVDEYDFRVRSWYTTQADRNRTAVSLNHNQACHASKEEQQTCWKEYSLLMFDADETLEQWLKLYLPAINAAQTAIFLVIDNENSGENDLNTARDTLFRELLITADFLSSKGLDKLPALPSNWAPILE